MKQQTRKPSFKRYCDSKCPCNHTGYVFVKNEGQFKTYKGNAIKDELVQVLCTGSLGEWINDHRGNDKLPVYDAETMTLPGVVKQNQLF